MYGLFWCCCKHIGVVWYHINGIETLVQIITNCIQFNMVTIFIENQSCYFGFIVFWFYWVFFTAAKCKW